MVMSTPETAAPAAGHAIALIPAYNEARRVGAVVAGTRTHLPVLVVDDGSTDDTAVAAGQAGATGVRQTPNQGKGVALRTGLRWAIDRGYEPVVTLDADGQHDPAEIPAFLGAHARQAADLVIGARDFAAIPPVRRLANTLGRRSFSWAMGRDIRDNQSGYRLLSRRMVAAVLDSAETGFEFEVEMIVVCAQRGLCLAWVPIRTIYADETSHIDPLHHTIHFTRVVLQTRRAMRAFRHAAGAAGPGRRG
jgi:glycosyltransferase involved in cell wall biosynthesis